jgi:hypothetical protein
MTAENQSYKQSQEAPATSPVQESSEVISEPGAALEVRVVKMSKAIKDAISKSLEIAANRLQE